MKAFILLFALLAAGGAGAAELRVLSYNAWDLPLGLSKDRKTRVLGLCEHLKTEASGGRWDLVLLQEVWTPRVASILSKCGFSHSARSDAGYFQTGLLILSAHPIVDQRAIEYPLQSLSWASLFTGEWLSRKGALSAVIQLPDGQRVRVVNTHLAANYGPSRTFSDERRRQVEELSRWVGSLVRAEPIILGGDLNISPQFRNYDPIWDELPRYFPGFSAAAYPSGTCTYCESNSYAGETHGKLDHLWAGPGVRAVSAGLAMDRDGEVFSDHYGWEGVFTF